jgi:hypothetical protein
MKSMHLEKERVVLPLSHKGLHEITLFGHNYFMRIRSLYINISFFQIKI